MDTINTQRINDGADENGDDLRGYLMQIGIELSSVVQDEITVAVDTRNQMVAMTG